MDEENSEYLISGPSPVDNFIEQFDQVQLLRAVSALQLSPKNQGKEIRMEMFIHEILRRGAASETPLNYEELKEFFEVNFLSSYLEDPSVSFFTENIVFFGGNYRIYPGINIDVAERLNGFLETIFATPNSLSQEFKLKVQEAAWLLLILSESMSTSAQTERYTLDEDEEEQIFVPEYEQFNSLYGAVSFSKSFISKICTHYRIPESTLAAFLIDVTLIIEEYNPDETELVDKPFVEIDGNLICLIPSNIAKSLCNYFKLVSTQLGEEQELSNAFFKWQESKLLDYSQEMKWVIADIHLPDSQVMERIVEKIFQIDANKLAYTCLIKTFDSSNETGSIAEMIYERITNVTAFLNEQNNGNTIVLTIILGGGFEDEMMIMWPKPSLNNHSLAFTFNDFEKIIFSGSLEPLSLWKFAKAHNKACMSADFSLGTSGVDLYGYYKENHGSLLPSDHTADHIVLMGSGTSFQRDVIEFRDEHGSTRIIDNKICEIPVKRTRKYAPIYKEQRKSADNNLLIETYSFPLWVMSYQAKSQQDYDQISLYIESVTFWMYRLTPNLGDKLNQLGKLPVEIVLTFDPKIISEFNPHVWENSGDFERELKFDVKHRILKIEIPFSLVGLLSANDNSGEQVIVKAVLKAFNVLLGRSKCELMSEDFIDGQIARVLSPPHAKMILYSNSGDNPLLDKSQLPSIRYVVDTEKELIADYLVEMLELTEPLPHALVTSEDKNKLCLKIVGTLLGKIIEKLKPYDGGKLLKWLVIMNERLTYQTEYNDLLLPHQLACYSDFPSEVKNMIRKDANIVPTSLAVRGLIELIVANPEFGAQSINLDDLDEMIALMDEVIHWANIADSIVLLGNDPEIGLLPSGRIGVNDLFNEQFVAPYNNSHAEAAVYQSTNPAYEKNDDGAILVNNEETDAAFLAEWGVRLTTLTAIYGSLTTLGLENEISFMSMKEDELFFRLPTYFAKPVSDTELRLALELLTLSKRKSVSKAPKGFDDKDILPWRYNRALSYVRRPLLKVTYPGDNQATYHWGFRHTFRSYMQFTNLIDSGKLRVAEKGSIETNVISYFVERNGKRYRKKVFDWFKQNTDLRVIDYEVKIDIHGHLVADINYGDIDVMVIDDNLKVIYAIECKNTASARVIHEMKTELDSYIGQDGQGGHILKHLNRHNWVIEHNKQLIKYVDSPDAYTFKSLVLTSNIIPAIYLAKNRAALPIYSFQDLRRKGFKYIAETFDHFN